MCFWWYKVTSFWGLSPGIRNTCRYLKAMSGVERRPSSRSSPAAILAHTWGLGRGSPPPRGCAWNSQGLCEQNSYSDRDQLRPKATILIPQMFMRAIWVI